MLPPRCVLRTEGLRLYVCICVYECIHFRSAIWWGVFFIHAMLFIYFGWLILFFITSHFILMTIRCRTSDFCCFYLSWIVSLSPNHIETIKWTSSCSFFLGSPEDTLFRLIPKSFYLWDKFISFSYFYSE